MLTRAQFMSVTPRRVAAKPAFTMRRLERLALWGCAAAAAMFIAAIAGRSDVGAQRVAGLFPAHSASSRAALSNQAGAGPLDTEAATRELVQTVRGLTEDLDEFDVVLGEEDVANLRERSRFGVVSQTTQAVDKVRRLVQLIRGRFPKSEVRFVDTICQPTKQRQNAAVELAQKCDVVVVIGGAHSNNTHELVKTCSRICPRVHHVQTAADLRAEWFCAKDNVGITAGTSTPDSVIAAVEETIRGLAVKSGEFSKAIYS